MDTDGYFSWFYSFFSSIEVQSLDFSHIIAILFAAILLLASGFASASEIAFFSLTPIDLSEIEEEKHKSDSKILQLLSNSQKLLATILVTNNLVNVTIVILCNFFFMNVLRFSSEIVEFLVITVILTFILLLFGEIIPKIYSAQKTLKFCRFAAPTIYLLTKVFQPITNLLVKSTARISKSFGRTQNISVSDLSQALQLTDEKEISEENNILKGIIKFGNETVKEVMTSRLDMVVLSTRTPFKEVINSIIENVYSRIPIYSDSVDNIKGILYIKDLLPHINKGDNFRWQSLIRPAYFVPETKMIDDLLNDFQKNKIHIAIVVDEYGGTSGLITMEDIIEEIVGEIHDEYDEEENKYKKIDENTWIFEGKTSLSDFYKATNIEEDIFSELEEADTLAGVLLEAKGEFPQLNEKIRFGNYEFEVIEKDNRRISGLKFKKLNIIENNS